MACPTIVVWQMASIHLWFDLFPLIDYYWEPKPPPEIKLLPVTSRLLN